MALAPARLLLPVRAVEPPHSSALSSASACSAAGAYPHFSSFFFHPSCQRSSFSVSAGVLEAHNNRAYKQSRHNQFRGPPDEAVSFDDVQNPYAEGRFGQPRRDLNGRARSAPRFGRFDGNGGRREWEPNNYPPWKKHGFAEREVKARYNEPLSSQGNRNVSSWTSHAGEETGHQGQTMIGRNSRRYGFEVRDTENNGYARPRNAYRDRESTPWQRQGDSFQGGASRFDSSRQESPPDTFSPWKSSGYQEKRGNLNTSWGSSTVSSEEFGQHSDRYVMDTGRRFHSLNGALSSRPPVQSSYLMQGNVRERTQQEEVQGYQEETVDRVKGANSEFLGEQENSSISDSSPISRIMQKLRSVEDRIPPLHAREVPHPRSELEDVLALPSAREYLSDRSSPKLSAEQPEKQVGDTRFPWERKDVEDSTVARARTLRPQSSAELTIPGPELRRLRILSLHLKQRVKIGKHGVTRDLVNSIQRRFQTCEVVKVKCEGPPAGNMKKTLETLEEQTGGLIIWKSGSAAVLYRGQNYGQPVSEIVDELLAKKYRSLMSSDGSQGASLRSSKKSAANEVGFSNEGDMDSFDGMEDVTEQPNSSDSVDDAREHLLSDASLGGAKKQPASKRTRTSRPEFENLEEYLMEVDNLLKDLGPRYEEWTGAKPLPIDGDLLSSSIPNYSPPYRLLPFGKRPNLSNTKATHLRRLSRPLAPHFVIGRDRGLQGLAAAMVKLWEKSEIAKIGVKRGILNSSHEIIIEDLKQLTGGFLLCRDKYSITFYRGNDFLPQTISAALADHQTRVEALQVEEERRRADGSVNIVKGLESSRSQPSWVHLIDPEEQIRLKKAAARSRRLQVIAHLERRLKMALEKKKKAEREIDKVEELIKPVAPSDDIEILTDEERFMLRKLGLKMKAFLLLGRRGVFSGVVQNMHLHWKHRELVKIVVKERDPVRLNETARMLEAESGGTLISVDPTSKGFAIVVYRGKNYARPPELRPPNLLTKRLALRRSLEMQRRESLSRHMSGLEEEIAHIRAGLSKMKMLESSDECVQSKESNNAHHTLESRESQQYQVGNFSHTELQGLTEDFVQESSTKQDLFEYDEVESLPKLSRRKLESLCEIGPIFKAVRLSKTERHVFRNEVLKMGKAFHFLVGRSNPMSAIAKAVRLHFLHHAFVKIGVAYRPRGASVQDVVEELEDLTGGTAYAQDDFRVILYRGWPSGEDMPLGGLYDVLSPEQCEILEADEDEDEEDEDDDEESVMENTPTQAAEKIREDEELDEDEDAEDEDWDTLSDEEDWDSVSDKQDDEDVHDEEGNDELRSEAILARSFVSSDDEEAESRSIKEDEEDDEDWDSLLDEEAEEEGKDELRSEASLAKSFVRSDDEVADSRSIKVDVEDDENWDSRSDEEDEEEGIDELRSEAHLVKSFVRSDDEEADFRSIKVDYGRFPAGVSGGVGGDEMVLDFDLDEDV